MIIRTGQARRGSIAPSGGGGVFWLPLLLLLLVVVVAEEGQWDDGVGGAANKDVDATRASQRGAR